MSRASVLILLGVLVILAPFSGFPIALRSLFALVLGACVIGIGLMLRTQDAHPAQPHEDIPAPPPVSAPEPVPDEPIQPTNVSPI